MKKIIFIIFISIINITFSNFSRIISTSPSNTEILLELGMKNKIIAVDTHSKNILDLNSSTINLGNGIINVEAILNLNPDLILISTYNIPKSEKPFKIIEDLGIPIYYIDTPKLIADIPKTINKIGSIIGEKEKSEQLSENFKNEINILKKIGTTRVPKKTIYFEINSEPNIFSFGDKTFLNELINILGGENIFKNKTGWILSDEEIIFESNPDIIFITSHNKNTIQNIKDRPHWNSLSAIKKNKIYILDESILRPSHKILKTLKKMNEYIEVNY